MKDTLKNDNLYDFIKYNSFEYLDVINNVEKLNKEYNNEIIDEYSDDVG